MDLHQAFRILAIGPGGAASLADPSISSHAGPWTDFVLPGGPLPRLAQEQSLEVDIPPGKTAEFSVPAWCAALLWARQGFCLTGTDGESPEVHAGSLCVYLRRNRDSSVFLVAGPDGFSGRLHLGAPNRP